MVYQGLYIKTYAGGSVDGWKCGRVDGWKSGRVDGWTSKRDDGWTSRRDDGWTECVNSHAIREANREGAPHIELVDGEKLVGMFKKVELGVKPKKIFEVDISYFAAFIEKKPVTSQ